jgi:hypothetical protein
MVALMACRLSFCPPERVVGEIDRVHFQRRVAVHELVELLRAQREGGQHLAVVVVLLAVGDDASLDQRHDAVADHFGVDAEVVLVGQLHHHGVGNAAVADLQRGAIGNHVGDVFADRLLDRADLRQADFEDGLVALAQGGDLRDVDVAIAIGEGDVRIDFEHDDAGLFDGGHGVVGGQGQREETVLVHRRGHAEHHIGRHQAALISCGISEK